MGPALPSLRRRGWFAISACKRAKELSGPFALIQMPFAIPGVKRYFRFFFSR